MSILSYQEIKEKIGWEEIGVKPQPKEYQYQPCSLDLRLDNSLLEYTSPTIDSHDSTTIQSFAYSLIDPENGFRFKPGEFVLGQTLEEITLPPDIVARVEGRSSIGRIGLAVHVTAGFIDPGFSGKITLEMVNLANHDILIYPGQRVCQIVFEELSQPTEKPYGLDELSSKYQGQSYPTPSYIFEDEVLEDETQNQ